MAKFLLRNLLFVVFLAGCSPSSHNTSGTHHLDRSTINESSNWTLPVNDTSSIDQKDSILHAKPLSLMDLPQSQDGEIILSEGFYEADFKGYCLQPGTPSPSDHDAYRQGPLTAYRRDIVETILRNSLTRPDLEQRNIQLLLWSVVSGSDYNRLSWEVHATAEQLLSRKQIFELKGGVLGVVKTVSSVLPQTGALNQMKQLFEMGTSSYEAYERIAVLQETSRITRAEIKKDQWYKQPEGYWLRYFPSGYQHVKVQVYVPKGSIVSGNSDNYLLFDPVTMMAIPANSNSQRLGIGAPVVDVIRKIIQVQKIPPPTKRPPVKSQNPKEVIMK
jgi:hypothetical protein